MIHRQLTIVALLLPAFCASDAAAQHGQAAGLAQQPTSAAGLQPGWETGNDPEDSRSFWITDETPGSDVASDTDNSRSGDNSGSAYGTSNASAREATTTSAANNDVQRFDRFDNGDRRMDVGVDLYSPPEFEGGLIVFGEDVAMKIGGFVKADFIHDFKPIDSTDSFITTSIPVGAPQRTNSRFHTRQTRLNFDTRWVSDDLAVRVFIEADFFDQDLFNPTRDSFRLRHAYGQVGPLLVGRYWTVFSDVVASPGTLDFEGSVSNVNRRRAQARWTQPFGDNVSLAVAVEDTDFIIDAPEGITGEVRTPSPDFTSHLRWQRERMRLQLAGVYRIGGFRGGELKTGVRSRLAQSSERPQGEWNRMVAEVHDGEVTVSINDVLQNKANGCPKAPSRVGLRIERYPIEFRNVLLLPLE